MTEHHSISVSYYHIAWYVVHAVPIASMCRRTQRRQTERPGADRSMEVLPMAQDNAATSGATVPGSSGPGGHSSRLDRIGIPKPLFFGFVAVLLFMVGDGVESGFIAPYMSANGAGSDVRASYVITTYGVAVMLASWLSGALSELWRPRRVMMLGFVIWVVFDVLFLALALGPHNYA